MTTATRCTVAADLPLGWIRFDNCVLHAYDVIAIIGDERETTIVVRGTSELFTIKRRRADIEAQVFAAVNGQPQVPEVAPAPVPLDDQAICADE